MLLHYCRCGRLIPQGETLCEQCKAKHLSRHTAYNRQVRSAASAAFYVSRAWRIMRARMMDVFDGWDIVAYFEDHKLVKADMVHHIVELEEDWEKRLDPMNLIPLNQAASHTRITAIYKSGPDAMKAYQNRLREYRERWFREQGGVQKVFERAGLVAPLSVTEKSPHEEKFP